MTFEEYWMEHEFGGAVPISDEELKKYFIAKDCWETSRQQLVNLLKRSYMFGSQDYDI